MHGEADARKSVFKVIGRACLDPVIFISQKYKGLPLNQASHNDKVNFNYLLINTIAESLGETSSTAEVLKIAKSFEEIENLAHSTGDVFLSIVVKNGAKNYQNKFDYNYIPRI